MTVKLPLVSIYIPTHNRSALLSRAIESVLAQTYKNIEILVCSDGSKDDTNLIMEQYCKTYSNITFLKNDVPQGACVARNRCLSVAQGKYVTGLDDDDIFHPQRVELLLENFEEKYAFLCSQWVELDLSVNTVNSDILSFTNNKVQLIDLSLLLNENIVGNQLFTLTERLRSIRGFDENMPAWQDYDTWVRMIKEFGPAKKVLVRTYYADIDHKRARISTSSNRYKGCLQFYQKHQTLLNKSQVKNSKIRMSIIGGESLSVFELFKLFNISSFKFWAKAWLIKLKMSNS